MKSADFNARIFGNSKKKKKFNNNIICRSFHRYSFAFDKKQKVRVEIPWRK